MGKPESQILNDVYRDVYKNVYKEFNERLNLLYGNNVPKHLLQVLERVQHGATGETTNIDPIQMMLDLLAMELATSEVGAIQALEEKTLQVKNLHAKSEEAKTHQDCLERKLESNRERRATRSIKEEQNNPDRLKRRIERTKLRITYLKEKHGETPSITHNYFGGWELGYLEGRLSVLEDLYDETTDTELTP